MQVYALPQDRVHVDSTTAALYHGPAGNPLVAFGQSKDHRPDLAQFKVMMSSLGPFGLPLAILVEPGNQADDRLYLPVIEQSRQVLQRRGLLYIGDSKMEALAIRAALAGGDDFYLTPLSKKGTQEQLLHDLLEPVWTQQQTLTDIYASESEASDPRLLARADETVRSQVAQVADESVSWEERLLLVYSPTLAEAGNQGLTQRLDHAQEALLGLTPPPSRGRRQFTELVPLQSAADAILKRYQVTDLLNLIYDRQESQRQVRVYPDRPARTETTVRYQLQVTSNQDAIDLVRRRLGWRLFVTNAAPERLSLEEAVRAFQPITLTSVSLPGQRIVHITPLTPLQTQILALLGLPDSVYTDLAKSADAIPP